MVLALANLVGVAARPIKPLVRIGDREWYYAKKPRIR
jgi:hypothetical protein